MHTRDIQGVVFILSLIVSPFFAISVSPAWGTPSDESNASDDQGKPENIKDVVRLDIGQVFVYQPDGTWEPHPELAVKGTSLFQSYLEGGVEFTITQLAPEAKPSNTSAQQTQNPPTQPAAYTSPFGGKIANASQNSNQSGSVGLNPFSSSNGGIAQLKFFLFLHPANTRLGLVGGGGFFTKPDKLANEIDANKIYFAGLRFNADYYIKTKKVENRLMGGKTETVQSENLGYTRGGSYFQIGILHDPSWEKTGADGLIDSKRVDRYFAEAEWDLDADTPIRVRLFASLPQDEKIKKGGELKVSILYAFNPITALDGVR